MVVSRVTKIASTRSVSALPISLPTQSLLSSARAALGNVASAVADHSLLIGGTVVATTVVGLSAAAATCYLLRDSAKEEGAISPVGKPFFSQTAGQITSQAAAQTLAKPRLAATSGGSSSSSSSSSNNVQNAAEVRRELQHSRAEAQKTMENLQRMRVKLSKLEEENKQLNGRIEEKQTRLAQLGKERKGTEEMVSASKTPPADGPSGTAGGGRGVVQKERDLQEVLRYNVAVIEAAAERSEFLLRKIMSEQEAVSAILKQSMSRLDTRIDQAHKQTSHAKLDLLTAAKQKDKTLEALSAACLGKAQLPAVITEIAKQNRLANLRSQFSLPQGSAFKAAQHPFAQMKARESTVEYTPSYEPIMEDPGNSTQIRRNGKIDLVINSLPTNSQESGLKQSNVAKESHKSSEASSFAAFSSTRESGRDDVSSSTSVKTEGGSTTRLKKSSSRKALESLGSCFGLPKKQSQTQLFDKPPQRSNESLSDR